MLGFMDAVIHNCDCKGNQTPEAEIADACRRLKGGLVTAKERLSTLKRFRESNELCVVTTACLLSVPA
jgi:hypothetical protein